jgi:hypothetical protein
MVPIAAKATAHGPPLLRLPVDQRDAILAEVAAIAEADYLHDPELTAFNAFGPADLYDAESEPEDI